MPVRASSKLPSWSTHIGVGNIGTGSAFADASPQATASHGGYRPLPCACIAIKQQHISDSEQDSVADLLCALVLPSPNTFCLAIFCILSGEHERLAMESKWTHLAVSYKLTMPHWHNIDINSSVQVHT